MGKRELIQEAKEDLMIKCDLQDNQALVNIVVEYEKEYLYAGIGSKITCFIVADVVEFH